jgi:hypothetical protein
LKLLDNKECVMNRTKLYRTFSALAAVTVLTGVVLALPGNASAEVPARAEAGWQIRFYAAAIDMDDGTSDASFDVDIGGGVGFNAEYRFSPRFGVDLGVLSGAGIDIAAGRTWAGDLNWVTHDTVTFTPLTAGLDIHLTPDARVDLYACPMVALVQYGGFAVRSGPNGVRTEWDFDEDFALGATLGLGVPLGGERWSFQTSLTYLETSIDGSSNNGLRLGADYDSTIFGFGLGYRFGRQTG